MYNFLFWVTVQLLCLWLLNSLTRHYRNRKLFKILHLPSLLVEGTARLAACFVAAKPVEKIEFLEDQKPFLSDGKSRIAYFGAGFFLVAWQMLIFLAFYSWITSIESFCTYPVTLPHINADAITQGFIQFDARSYLQELKNLLLYTPWSSIELWFLLYLTIGVFPFCALTAEQLKGGLVIVSLLGLFTTAMDYLGIRTGFLSRGWYLTRWVLPEFFSVYSFFLTLLCLTLMAHFAARIASRGAQALLLHAAQKSRDEKVGKPKRHAKSRQVAHH